MPALLKTAFLSLLALLGALLALALVTTVASWLPALIGLHPDSATQLGWDLAFTVLGGIAAIGFATRYAPAWPSVHGTVVILLITAASLWAVWDMGNEFPRWFVGALLASLPVQAAVGLRIGRPVARDADRRQRSNSGSV